MYADLCNEFSLSHFEFELIAKVLSLQQFAVWVNAIRPIGSHLADYSAHCHCSARRVTWPWQRINCPSIVYSSNSLPYQSLSLVTLVVLEEITANRFQTTAFIKKKCRLQAVERAAHSRPDPSTRRRNKMFLCATYLHEEFNEDPDELLEGEPASLQNRRECAEYLLNMDTGDWKHDEIVHHCSGITCCRSTGESKIKLWIAIQAGRFS